MARRSSAPAAGEVAPQVPSDETIAREKRVLELKRAGFTFDVIARETGYAGKGPAYKAYRRALARTLQQPAAELRLLEQDRLDQLQVVVWTRALGGDEKAIASVLRIMERRARLLGLDHADGLAERKLNLDEQLAELFVVGLGQFLADLGLADDPNARSAVGALLQRLHVQTLELDAGGIEEAVLVPERPPARRPAAKKVSKPPPVKATATRLDKPKGTP